MDKNFLSLIYKDEVVYLDSYFQFIKEFYVINAPKKYINTRIEIHL